MGQVIIPNDHWHQENRSWGETDPNLGCSAPRSAVLGGIEPRLGGLGGSDQKNVKGEMFLEFNFM